MNNTNISPTTSTGIIGYKYAGFWIRLLAVFIDWIILGIIGFIMFGSEVTSVGDGSVGVNYTGWKTIVPLSYVLIFWIWQSATPGKLICKIKIINEDGTELNWKRAVVRFFAYIISALPILIGFIWIGFDRKKQGWHDKIAKTYVVKKSD